MRFRCFTTFRIYQYSIDFVLYIYYIHYIVNYFLSNLSCFIQRINYHDDHDNFETFIIECDEFRLLLRESSLIFPDEPPLNRYVTSISLEPFS